MRNLADLVLAIGAVATAGQATLAPSGPIYRWRDANGTTVYAQRLPGPGGHGPVTALSLRTDPDRTDPAPRGAVADPVSPADLAQRRFEAEAAVEQAQGRLAGARRDLANGAEPLPGERIGTVFHHSRLRPAYFERQRGLLDAVRQAQAALTRAQVLLRQLNATQAD